MNYFMNFYMIKPAGEYLFMVILFFRRFVTKLRFFTELASDTFCDKGFQYIIVCLYICSIWVCTATAEVLTPFEEIYGFGFLVGVSFAIDNNITQMDSMLQTRVVGSIAGLIRPTNCE